MPMHKLLYDEYKVDNKSGIPKYTKKSFCPDGDVCLTAGNSNRMFYQLKNFKIVFLLRWRFSISGAPLHSHIPPKHITLIAALHITRRSDIPI
jgi:hypothetical protein